MHLHSCSRQSLLCQERSESDPGGRSKDIKCNRRNFLFGVQAECFLSRDACGFMFCRCKVCPEIIVYYFDEMKILTLVIITVNRAFIVIADNHFINIFNNGINVLLLLSLRIVNVLFSYLRQEHRPVYMHQHYHKYDQVSQHRRANVNANSFFDGYPAVNNTGSAPANC